MKITIEEILKIYIDESGIYVKTITNWPIDNLYQ